MQVAVFSVYSSYAEHLSAFIFLTFLHFISKHYISLRFVNHSLLHSKMGLIIPVNPGGQPQQNS